MEAIEGSILNVVNGDLYALPVILEADQSELLQAAANLPQLMITKITMIRVLTALRCGDITADRVQQWASFVRRGYVSGKGSGGIQPIDIAYDKGNEELIAEIIARLDEIGDLIDGEVDAIEQQEMLTALCSQ